ncbi:MAG: dTDP-4-dehydrorhamnose reductase [Proteobacteria bacterium]|nr:dTDP-4-dehydrorhamnose reductase [Pseudomonadota bacterium]
MRPKVVISGGHGLLGAALCRAFADWRVIAPASRVFDITRADAVEQLIAREKPRLVIHSAAMTHVDQCEREPERAYRINREGTRNLADCARRHGARLVAISTDYVFSGDAGRPYGEDDEPGPRSVYGASKLAAEEACARFCPDHVIARVSWLFGPGRTCFVDSVVAWGQNRDDATAVRVAADQKSVPSSTRSVARAVRAIAESSHRGVFHIASPDGCSRYELARAVFDILDLPRQLEPCAMADFSTPAQRPRDSRLASRRLAELGVEAMPPWRDELAAYLASAYRH